MKSASEEEESAGGVVKASNRLLLPRLAGGIAGVALGLKFGFGLGRGRRVAGGGLGLFGGEAFTFWLLTKGSAFVKGEGRTDEEALTFARSEIARLERAAPARESRRLARGLPCCSAAWR